MSNNSEGVSTSQVLGEYRTALFEEPANNGDNTDIATLVRSLVDTMGRMETRLSKIETNTNALKTSIDTNTKTLHEIRWDLQNLTQRVNTTETEVKRVDKRVSDLENDLQGNSLLYDQVKESTRKLSEKVKLCAETKAVESELSKLSRRTDELNEKFLEARCRSMKYNLIFGGIKENENEVCEETIKTFIETELEVEDAQDMTFVNVHRIGKKIDPKRNGRPRSIVAKFAYNKDISLVKQSTNKLKGKHYRVNEQYPEEIEQRRKKTLPDSKGRKKEKIKSGASKRQAVRERHTH